MGAGTRSRSRRVDKCVGRARDHSARRRVHARVGARVGVDDEVDREVALQVVDRDHEGAADARAVVGPDDVRVDEHDLARHRLIAGRAEDARVDREAERGQLMSQALHAAAMTETDAGTLAERADDPHSIRVHRISVP